MNIYLIIIFSLLCHYNSHFEFESFPIDNNKLKTYWYNNEAEINTYELQQARYGEIHKGQASLIFVTESFSTDTKTKSDKPGAEDIPILKLNATRKFNTGVYPYSMMTSTFYPFEGAKNSVKISASSQEWCGHTYMEMNSKENMEFFVNSYFEGESIEGYYLDNSFMEDDVWSKIRLDYTSLPAGKFKMVPGFSYIRLRHAPIRYYDCFASLSEPVDGVFNYSLDFPELKRSLLIRFEQNFPHKILGWEDNYSSGWGANKKMLTTTATLIKTIKSDYWNRNSNKDQPVREELGLSNY